MTLGPGTPLICVDASAGYYRNHETNLTEGAMYFCDEVVFSPFRQCNRDDCGTYITLRDKGPLYDYCPGRFRPLNDGDTSLIEKELENV